MDVCRVPHSSKCVVELLMFETISGINVLYDVNTSYVVGKDRPLPDFFIRLMVRLRMSQLRYRYGTGTSRYGCSH